MRSSAAQIDATDPIARAAGRPILVIVAHGDDAALFAGGTIRRLADAGCRVHIARYTDDGTDSDGLDRTTTIERNAAEFEAAAAILGASSTTSLGFPTDTLGDVPRSVLREAAIRLIRTHQPYAVLTFDPYAAFYEDNQDHIRLAQEVDEAFWTSMFDKHHPEHFDQGMAAHGVVERWYFGRRLLEATDRIDIGPALPAKAAAAVAHRTMMGNLMRQLRLMGATAGVDAESLVSALRDQDRLVADWVGRNDREEFRIVRFAGFADFFANLDGVRA